MHGNFVDRTGERHGTTVVIKKLNKKRGRRTLWLCKCDCGYEFECPSNNLARIVQCRPGCPRGTRSKDAKRWQEKYPREYAAWTNMKDRCRNLNRREAARYVGRGITVCKRWSKFKNFLADMGPVPERYTLERVDNSKGYCPSNCTWATWKQQQRNRCNNHLITAFGKTQTLTEWCEEIGINEATIRARLRRGWSEVDAVTLL